MPFDITVPDTAAVILLGVIGRSMNQMKVLQLWYQLIGHILPGLDYLIRFPDERRRRFT